MNSKYFFIPIFAMVFFTGCYTAMKHPEIVDAENPQYDIPVYYSDDCGSCHQSGEKLLSEKSKLTSQPQYISRNERWAHFYQNPWWLTPLFSGHPSMGSNNSNSSGSAPLPTTSARPRYPGAAPGSGGGGTTPSLIGGGSPGNISTSAGSSSTGSSATSGKIRSGSNNSGRKAIRGSGNNSAKNSRPKAKRKKRN